MFQIFFSLFRSLGVWFRSKARVQLEIVACVINSQSVTENIQNQPFRMRIVFYGSGSPETSGRIGALCFSSSNPIP